MNGYSKEPAKCAGGIALNLHRDLDLGENGRDCGDVRDCGDGDGDGRGRDCESRHFQRLLAGTCTSRSSSALAPIESQFLVPVAATAVEAESPFLANKSWKCLDIALAAGQ